MAPSALGSSSLRLAWIRPTCRAIAWTPLLLITGALLTGTIVLMARHARLPEVIAAAAIGALAAGAVVGFSDEASRLLIAVPTSLARRLVHRAIPIALATGLIAAAILGSMQAVEISSPPAGMLAGALVALVTAGAAIHAVIGGVVDRSAEVAAGCVLAWVGSGWLPHGPVPEGLVRAWLTQPAWTTAAAVGAILISARHARS